MVVVVVVVVVPGIHSTSFVWHQDKEDRTPQGGVTSTNMAHDDQELGDDNDYNDNLDVHERGPGNTCRGRT